MEAGQVLLRLDGRLWAAAVRRAEIEARDAGRDLKRWKELEKTGADVFVHCAPGAGEEGRTIQEGDWVEFEADAVAHGLRAKNIRKLNLTPAGK